MIKKYQEALTRLNMCAVQFDGIARIRFDDDIKLLKEALRELNSAKLVSMKTPTIVEYNNQLYELKQMKNYIKLTKLNVGKISNVTKKTILNECSDDDLWDELLGDNAPIDRAIERSLDFMEKKI